MTIKFKHDSAIKMMEVSGEFNTFADFQSAVQDLGYQTENFTLYEPNSGTYYEAGDAIPSIENLKIFMTLKSKKVNSGAFTRPECYAKINEYSLREAIHTRYGKPYSSVSTVELNKFLQDYLSSLDSEEESVVEAHQSDNLSAFEVEVFKSLARIEEKVNAIAENTEFQQFQRTENI
jgi:hypothetical protein|nr:MAG TPA: hypothetical protein [Crassvirales sp.]